MSKSEQQIEQEIQSKNLNAPRITPDHIDAVIEDVQYFTAGDGAYEGQYRDWKQIGRAHV